MQRYLFKKKFIWFITVSIVIFLLIRCAIIFFGSSRFFCESELLRGTVAHEIMSNGAWPLLTYQCELHTGGTLIASLMIIPFFILLGKNLVSIKIVALIFSFLTLLCAYYFTHRCIKKPKAALLLLFWFAFATPLYLVYSTVFIGEHYASQLLSFLAMILFYKMTEEHISGKKKYILSFIFGLICGFSTYFSYTFVITLMTCLFVWFFIDRLFFLRKQFFIFAVSALIGFTPRLLFNRMVNISSLMVRDGSILEHIELQTDVFVERIIFLITVYWPHGLWMGDVGNLKNFPLMGTLLGILFIVSYCHAVKKYGNTIIQKNQFIKNRALFLVLFYPLVFVFMHSANNYNDEFMRKYIEHTRFIRDYSEFKYVFSIFPYVFIIISLFLTNKSVWGESKRMFVRLMPIVLCLFLWFFSLFGVSKLIAAKNYEMHMSRWKPYSYHLLGEQVARIFFKSSLSEKIEYIKEIEMPYRNYAYLGLGFETKEGIYNASLVMTALPLITRESRKYFVRGLGAECGDHLMNIGDKGNLERDCPIYNDIPENLKLNYVEGIGVFAGVSREDIVVENLGRKYLSAYYRAYAVGKLRIDRGDLDKTFLGMRDIPLEYRNDFTAGLLTWKEYFIDFEIDQNKLMNFIKTHSASNSVSL